MASGMRRTEIVSIVAGEVAGWEADETGLRVEVAFPDGLMIRFAVPPHQPVIQCGFGPTGPLTPKVAEYLRKYGGRDASEPLRVCARWFGGQLQKVTFGLFNLGNDTPEIERVPKGDSGDWFEALEDGEKYARSLTPYPKRYTQERMNTPVGPDSMVSVGVSYDPAKLVTRYDGVVEIPADALGKVESVQFVDETRVPAHPPFVMVPGPAERFEAVPIMLAHEPAATVNVTLGFDEKEAAERLAKHCLEVIGDSVAKFNVAGHSTVALDGGLLKAGALTINQIREKYGRPPVKVDNKGATSDLVHGGTDVVMGRSPLEKAATMLNICDAIDKAQAEAFKNAAVGLRKEREKPPTGCGDGRYWGPYAWNESARMWVTDADWRSPAGVNYLKGTPVSHIPEAGDGWTYDDLTGWTTALDKPPRPAGEGVWTYNNGAWVRVTATASTDVVKLTIPNGAKERVVEVKVGGAIDRERFLNGVKPVKIEAELELAPCDESGTHIDHIVYGDPAAPKPEGVIHAKAENITIPPEGGKMAFTDLGRYFRYRPAQTLTAEQRKKIMDTFREQCGGRQREGKLVVEPEGVEVLPDNVLRDKDGKPVVMTDAEFAEFTKPGAWTHNEAGEFVNLALPDGPGNVWPLWVHRNDPTPRPEHIGKLTVTTDDGRELLNVAVNTEPVKVVVNTKHHPHDITAHILDTPEDMLTPNPFAERLVLDGLIRDAKKITGEPKEMDFVGGKQPGRVVSRTESAGVYPSTSGSVTIIVVDDPQAAAVPSSDEAVRKWHDETMAGRKAKPRPNPAEVVPIEVKAIPVPIGADDFAATRQRCEEAAKAALAKAVPVLTHKDTLNPKHLCVATRAAAEREFASQACKVRTCARCSRNILEGDSFDLLETCGETLGFGNGRVYIRRTVCPCGYVSEMSVKLRDLVEGDLDGLLDIDVYAKNVRERARQDIAAAIVFPAGGMMVADPPPDEDDPQPFVVGG